MFCLTMLIYKIRLDPKYFVMKRMKLKLIFLALVIIVLVTVCIHLWVSRIELTSLTRRYANAVKLINKYKDKLDKYGLGDK